MKRIFLIILTLALIVCSLAGCAGRPSVSALDDAIENLAGQLENVIDDLSATPGASAKSSSAPTADNSSSNDLDENGIYDSRDDVALYIHTYGHLPSNYITKDEARDLGWSGGSVEKYAPGKCIGGDRFGNYDGNLPDVDGRTYRECDINTLGASSRGAERIVYSNDGCVYYTKDHYETFKLLYGEE